MNMLNDREANEMREAVLSYRLRTDIVDPDEMDPFSLDQHSTEWGMVDVIDATGRATCRQCGEKIAKGAKSIRFEYDFTGSGSWTCQSVQIHLYACERG